MLILPFVPADFPGRWVYDDDLSVQRLGVAYRSGCPVPVLAVVDGKECPGMVHHVPVAVKQAAIVVARRLSLPIGPSLRPFWCRNPLFRCPPGRRSGLSGGP